MAVKVVKDVTSELKAWRVVIGTTATPLGDGTFKSKRGFRMIAKDDNAVPVYTGGADVTAGAGAATDGFPVKADRELALPVEDPSKAFGRVAAGTAIVYLVAS